MRCGLSRRVLNCDAFDSRGRVLALALCLPLGCKPAAVAEPVVELRVHPQPSNDAPREPTPEPPDTQPSAPVQQAAPAAPTLPASVTPGQLSTVRVPGHRAATVVHGQPHTTLAMVYLHGICGQVSRIAEWAAAAAEFVTTVAPMGNKPCPDSPSRFSWNQDIELIQRLIDETLAAVSEARNGQLDTSTLVLFGYSQGASRAERLVARFPARYPWVILGGPPRRPELEHFRTSQGLALLVGTEEHQGDLADLTRDFTARGVRAHFDEFTGVGHGRFGPSAPEVMRRTLRWLELPVSPEHVP